MNNLAPVRAHIPAMSEEEVGKVQQLERFILSIPQIEIPVTHTLHGGMYARTILLPAGAIITGALIKIATLLIAQGNALMYIGSSTVELQGYNVIPASAGRKQAFIAKTDTYLTMVFPSSAQTVEEAEDEFTDEADKLASRKGNG